MIKYNQHRDGVKMNYEFNFERLEQLRELTELGPIAKFKIMRARKQAEDYRKLYIKENPDDVIGVDYSTANELEYELRMNSLRKSLEKQWAEYVTYENDGMGLDQYVNDYLVEQLNNSKGRSM